MRHRGLFNSFALVLVLVVALTGCFGGGGGSGSDDYGDLLLKVQLPDDLSLSKVTASLSHSKKTATATENLVISGQTAEYKFKKLVTGKWNVLVIGKNQKGEEVITVTDTVTIAKDKEAKLNLSMVPKSWLDKPIVEPSFLEINKDEEVWVRVLVDISAESLASAEEGKSAVELFVSAQGPGAGADDWESKGYLFDNGVLGNGDEIKGDRVFSGYFYFNESTPGELSLKIVVKLGDGTSKEQLFSLMFVDVSNVDGQAIVSAHEVAKEKLNTMAPTLSTGAMLDELANVLKAETPAIENISVAENLMQIEYASGLQSFILLTDEDENLLGGGGATVPLLEREQQMIPLHEQTRGATVDFGDSQESFSFLAVAGSEIASRSVLLWSPFAQEMNLDDLSSLVVEVFESAELGFDVTSVANNHADVDSLRNLTDYGVTVLLTHGSGGRWVATGEVYDENDSKYVKEQVMGQIGVWQNMKKVKNGNIEVYAPVYAVSDEWFRDNLYGEFPNSIIVNSSCQSGSTDHFWSTFEQLGAGAYFGFDGNVYSEFALDKVHELSEGLAQGWSIEQSYKPGSDPVAGGQWKAYGNPYLLLKGGFLNGSFEEGLAGWTTDGDGRVVSSLGYLEPTNQHRMAIISTGLGFTEEHGEISQTFTVANNVTELKFDWNFLSEEFLEFINTEFMDWFKVSVTVDGETTVLLQKTIDDIAEDFGAVHCNSGYNNWEGCIESGANGDLIRVSPKIVFDRGDVWMTDWQSFSHDFSEYGGKKVTLTFGCHDVGDSAYDTAILLDNIRIE